MIEDQRLRNVSIRGKGACFGQAGVALPRVRRREGVSKKAIIFVLSVLICIRFRRLHCWQTCNIACSSRGHDDMRAKSST